jgi:LPXTG-motif cell wall-anchored protein
LTVKKFNLKIKEMRNILIIVVGLIILGVAGFFFINRNNKSTTSTTTNTSTPSANNSNTVSIENFSFNPSEITVKKGTEVTWTNNDSTTHTVTSDTNAFQSGDITPGSTYKFTFSQTGTFSYHCSIHTTMTGKVIVQ